MRLSCSGCRVLRKGCSDDCSIRPCLEWIKSPESQANATVFLAKFYGRAGLMNLINAGPPHLRPAIFRSLLYESCGRIVNPINGSVGLMLSGSWHLCQSAVEAVLKGASITPMATTDAAEGKNGPPLKACDIRHINREENSTESDRLHRVRTRTRFKRSGGKPKPGRVCVVEEDVNRSPSHESSLSHELAGPVSYRVSQHSESLSSAATAEPEAVDADERLSDGDEAEAGVQLDLTLGFEPARRCTKEKELDRREAGEKADEGVFCRMRLGLDYGGEIDED